MTKTEINELMKQAIDPHKICRDADGVWIDELFEMPFSQITSITFGSRYVEVFSKYLPPIM